VSIAERARAVAMLKEVHIIYESFGTFAPQPIVQKTGRAETELIAAYQQEIMRLRDAVKIGNADAIRESAGRLKDGLADCYPKVQQLLDRLIGANRESVVSK
jgi:hypothetical protein